MFFYHLLQLCPQGHISKMLAVTVIENTVLSAFGIFKSVSCLIRMRLRKIFFCKHVLLSFSSTLSPRSYLENACCNRYWKHGFMRLWNFQIRFLPYSNAFAKKFFFANMFFYHLLQLCPQGHISKMLAVTVIENTVLSAFGIFKSVSCLIRMHLRKNFFWKHVLLSFTSTLSPRSYLENACCNRYWKHGFKRLWNFQIRFLPYSNAFAKNFFLQTCSFIIFFNFVPKVISRKCLL